VTVTRTPPPELDVEQEIDFRRWRESIVARWWLPAAGLVAGIVLGLLVSIGGAQVYQAKALISLGQPFSPGGGAIQSFATNPRAVGEIVRSESAIKQAAHAGGMRPGQLRGKVSSAQVGVGSGAGARLAVPLVELSVQGSKPAKVERAANELAKIVVARTSTPYVGTKIKGFTEQLTSLQEQLNVLAPRITALEREVGNTSLAPLDRLLLATQLDNAQQRRGQLINTQSLVQQELALAQNVESAKVIQEAAAVKTTARSRRNSVLVGALIGLILGLVAALVADAAVRPRA
jgi:uncharacterized protein involved in exopolysaccharide biosynthesis